MEQRNDDTFKHQNQTINLYQESRYCMLISSHWKSTTQPYYVMGVSTNFAIWQSSPIPLSSNIIPMNTNYSGAKVCTPTHFHQCVRNRLTDITTTVPCVNMVVKPQTSKYFKDTKHQTLHTYTNLEPEENKEKMKIYLRSKQPCMSQQFTINHLTAAFTTEETNVLGECPY